jgi:hypothetical protein
VPALAIRAVQAGALTSKMDRELPADDPDQLDFDRALDSGSWPLIGGRLRLDWRIVTHFPIPDLGSVILGVKNREELRECLDAERDPRLTLEEIAMVEAVCR